uniref:Ovule protein n=1 Tax=Syphacia muris TaxID=451379 RepID=A0A0N5AXA2_9BILA
MEKNTMHNCSRVPASSCYQQFGHYGEPYCQQMPPIRTDPPISYSNVIQMPNIAQHPHTPDQVIAFIC